MFASLLLGSSLAFAAAIQPGPLQAYLLSSVAQHGWRKTMPAALAPICSDGPIVLTVLFVLTRLPDAAAHILQAAGGFLLLYFAWSGYRRWRRGPVLEEDASAKGSRTLLEAMGINLLNPNPWLGWTLVMGPALLAAWHTAPANGIAFLLSFYGVIVSATALIVLLFGSTSFLSPRIRHNLVLVSALLLAGLGIYRLAASLSAN
jgi:threonine/homoserine/homoserine lactone efflux protein